MDESIFQRIPAPLLLFLKNIQRVHGTVVYKLKKHLPVFIYYPAFFLFLKIIYCKK